MNPEHTALVARLELKEMHVGDTDKAAAAIRALAGEVERLNASIATLNVFVTEILNERDTLRAERDNMKACWDAACHDIADRDDKLAALRAEVAALRKAITEHNNDCHKREPERALALP